MLLKLNLAEMLAKSEKSKDLSNKVKKTDKPNLDEKSPRALEADARKDYFKASQLLLSGTGLVDFVLPFVLSLFLTF